MPAASATAIARFSSATGEPVLDQLHDDDVIVVTGPPHEVTQFALDHRLAVVSSTGAPAGGLAFVMTLDLVILVVFGVAKAEPIDVFFYFATIGTLSLLAMYVMTNVAATRFLAGQGSRLELVLPLAGIAVALYVLYHNVYPVPDSPYNAFPYVVAAWLAVGVGFAAWRRR